MDLYDELALKIKSPEPAVWFQRIVLYEQLDPVPVEIRSVKLTRGLNIVWADDPGNDVPDAEITGHSAGKTAFCRLIRYLLGEPTYATKANTTFIRQAMKAAYVGAEMHVGGNPIAVIRPIGIGRVSYVGAGISLETLMSDRGYGVFPSNYLEKLGVLALLDGLGTKTIVQTGEPIQWGHLLAWITRDQECRFQNIYDWRSPRSESDSPSFQFPKAGPLFLMRAALGMILPDEMQGEKELASAIVRRANLERQQSDLRKEPEYRVYLFNRELKKRLIASGEDAGDIAKMPFEAEGLLPGLDDTAKRVTLRLERELATYEDAVKAKLEEREQIRVEIGVREKQKEQLDAIFGLGGEASKELDFGLSKRQEQRRAQQQASVKDCLPGGIPFADCKYVQQRQRDLQVTQISDKKMLQDQQERRQKERDKIDAEKAKFDTEIEDLKKDLRTVSDEHAKLEQTFQHHADDLRELKRAHDLLKEWTERLNNLDGLDELRDCETEIEGVDRRIKTLEFELEALINTHEKHRELLASIFSAAARSVLPSGTYDGKVRLDNRELAYEITHGSAMSGEAVETLSVLLSDICNLIYASVCETATLPGFLVHDSPREADLSIRLYSNFMRFVASLQNHFASHNNCPFQYILTTTTKPPKELRGNKYVKLRLDASKPGELLFRRDLSAAAAMAKATSRGEFDFDPKEDRSEEDLN